MWQDSLDEAPGFDSIPMELQLKCLLPLSWRDIAMFSCTSRGSKQLTDILQRHGHVRSYYDDISPVTRAAPVLQRNLVFGADERGLQFQAGMREGIEGDMSEADDLPSTSGSSDLVSRVVQRFVSKLSMPARPDVLIVCLSGRWAEYPWSEAVWSVFRQLMPRCCTVVGAIGGGIVGSRVAFQPSASCEGPGWNYQRHEGNPEEKDKDAGAIAATLLHVPPGVHVSTFCAGSVALLKGLSVVRQFEPVDDASGGWGRLDVFGAGPHRGLPEWDPSMGHPPHFMTLFNDENVMEALYNRLSQQYPGCTITGGRTIDRKQPVQDRRLLRSLYLNTGQHPREILETHRGHANRAASAASGAAAAATTSAPPPPSRRPSAAQSTASQWTSDYDDFMITGGVVLAFWGPSLQKDNFSIRGIRRIGPWYRVLDGQRLKVRRKNNQGTRLEDLGLGDKEWTGFNRVLSIEGIMAGRESGFANVIIEDLAPEEQERVNSRQRVLFIGSKEAAVPEPDAFLDEQQQQQQEQEQEDGMFSSPVRLSLNDGRGAGHAPASAAAAAAAGPSAGPSGEPEESFHVHGFYLEEDNSRFIVYDPLPDDVDIALLAATQEGSLEDLRSRLIKTRNTLKASGRRLDPDLNLLRGVFNLPPPVFSMVFPCTGRGAKFYEETGVEVEEFHRVFPDISLLGFFSGGEFGPAPQGERFCTEQHKGRIFGFTTVFSVVSMGD